MIQELEYEAPRMTVSPPRVYSADEVEIIDAINLAQHSFADGAVNMVNGTMQMIEALVLLKENGLYKQSPLVEHYEGRVGWKDYLRELVAWTKERNPEVQISMTGLQGGLWRYKVLVQHFGIDPHEAFGAHESTIRNIRKMARFDYKTGAPLELKDGFRVDLLPAPPGTPPERRLVEGLKTVIKDALSQPIINHKMFDDYRAGTGSIVTNVSFAVELDSETAEVVTLRAFIQQFDEDGKPMKDYAADLLHDPWPVEACDKLLDVGWTLEYV